MTREDWITVILTIVTASLLFVAYYAVLKPEIVVPMGMAGQCPDGWTFDETKLLCNAAYTLPAGCNTPYDPTTQLPTISEKCAFAKRCGTKWTGLC